MKSGIHPHYQNCTAHCACGNTFITRSTLAKINATLANASGLTYLTVLNDNTSRTLTITISELR